MDSTHRNTAHLLRSLELGGELLMQAFRDLADEEAHARPAAGKWSPLEILGHLVDEERGDFRVRLELTLADPTRPWPRIDPEGWVRERRHHERELAALLAELQQERRRSLGWLRGLHEPDWSRAHRHPQLGVLCAGDLLAAWAAHDFLHLRQLANTRLAFLRVAAEPYSTGYAGA